MQMTLLYHPIRFIRDAHSLEKSRKKIPTRTNAYISQFRFFFSTRFHSTHNSFLNNWLLNRFYFQTFCNTCFDIHWFDTKSMKNVYVIVTTLKRMFVSLHRFYWISKQIARYITFIRWSFFVLENSCKSNERGKKSALSTIKKKEYSKEIIAFMSPYVFSLLLGFKTLPFQHFDLNYDGNSLNVKCFQALSRKEHLFQKKKRKLQTNTFLGEIHS